MKLEDLLQKADVPNRAVDRACAILWWFRRQQHGDGLSAKEIALAIEQSGFPRVNYSRLDEQLSKDCRVHRVPGARSWRLKNSVLDEYDKNFLAIIGAPRPLPATDSVLPRTLFSNTRGYIEKVVNQINASYDAALYDCSAVMCRRLIETLIIEVYEHSGRASAIKGADGNFFMLSDLARMLLSDSAFNVSRNARKGLEDFKRLGDLSAHSRRYNAHPADIDRVRDGLRVAAEELLHIAGLVRVI